MSGDENVTDVSEKCVYLKLNVRMPLPAASYPGSRKAFFAQVPNSDNSLANDPGFSSEKFNRLRQPG